ncbi:MAG: hypothetical protein HYY95_09790 [Candidatus Rokubacteria bacterium]|nr:hypothetical protein [Candidatus Rokubacteria bacterium]MBI3105845.1 hypothetical protein [Candidatus Rokubacteria bacterium]
MSRILLVTQSTRSHGEFRRPWVRAAYRRYVRRYRDRVATALARLAREGQVTLLSARELVDPARVPAGVAIRFYDEESLKVDSEEVADLTRRLTSAWWPEPEAEPDLSYRGVWLPDLLPLARGIVLRMDVAEPLGIVERAWQDARPTRLVLLSGASSLERLAGLVGRREGLAAEIAAPRFLGARLYARAYRALQPREERLRLRTALTFPRRPRRARAPAAGRRIVFATCRPRHHFVVDPLAEAVRAAGGNPHVVASPAVDPELVAKLTGLGAAGVTWDYLSDFLPCAAAARLVRRYRRSFRAMWRRITAGRALERELRWRGLSLAEVARPLLRDSVERTLLVAVLFQEAAFRALDALQPVAVVVTSNRRYAERALALAARERHIPCLLFSGSLLMGRDQSRMFDIADRMLVIGEDLKVRLVREQKVDPALVSVVGDPRSNAARLLPPERLREEVFRDFGLAPDRPLLVMVSKYVSLLFSSEEKQAFYRTVLESLPLLPPLHVVVKVHPNEDMTLLGEQVRSWGWPDARFTKDYDIHRLFGAADAAVMVTSMAGMEAMALGCPVVAVQAPGKDYEGEYMPAYVGEGAAARVDMGDPRGLAATLGRLLTDDEARAALIERGAKFAARYVHRVDGALGQRLLGVVDEIGQELRQVRRP